MVLLTVSLDASGELLGLARASVPAQGLGQAQARELEVVLLPESGYN